MIEAFAYQSFSTEIHLTFKHNFIIYIAIHIQIHILKMPVVCTLCSQWPGPLLGRLCLLVNYDKNDHDEYPLTSHAITSCMLTADPDTIPHATTSFFPTTQQAADVGFHSYASVASRSFFDARKTLRLPSARVRSEFCEVSWRWVSIVTCFNLNTPFSQVSALLTCSGPLTVPRVQLKHEEAL